MGTPLGDPFLPSNRQLTYALPFGSGVRLHLNPTAIPEAYASGFAGGHPLAGVGGGGISEPGEVSCSHIGAWRGGGTPPFP